MNETILRTDTRSQVIKESASGHFAFPSELTCVCMTNIHTPNRDRFSVDCSMTFTHDQTWELNLGRQEQESGTLSTKPRAPRGKGHSRTTKSNVCANSSLLHKFCIWYVSKSFPDWQQNYVTYVAGALLVTVSSIWCHAEGHSVHV